MAPKRDRTSTGSEPQNRQRARLDDETIDPTNPFDREPGIIAAGPLSTADMSGEDLTTSQENDDADGGNAGRASGQHDGSDDDSGSDGEDGLAFAQRTASGSTSNGVRYSIKCSFYPDMPWAYMVDGTLALEDLSDAEGDEPESNAEGEGEKGLGGEKEQVEEDGESEGVEEEEDEGEVIGSYSAKFVKRNVIFDNFHFSMDEVSAEMYQLAREIFDKGGCLRRQFEGASMGPGQGTWGQKLDLGDILLLEEMYVEQSYRRQGFGRAMVRDLVRRARRASADSCVEFFVVCLPSGLTNVVRHEETGTATQVQDAKRRHEAIASQFFRSMGFKKIGSSDWYALVGVM